MLMVFLSNKEILAVSCEAHFTHCCFQSSSPTWLCHYCKPRWQAEHRGMVTPNVSNRWFCWNFVEPKGGSIEAEETTKKAHSLYEHFTCFSTYTQRWVFSLITSGGYQVLGVLRSLHSALPLSRSTMLNISKANNSKKQSDREAQITGSLRGNTPLSTSSEIWDQTQSLVTAFLSITKPVCITVNILLLTSTIFPLATGCWDRPELAFGWNVVTVAKVLFSAGQAHLKYASADLSLSQAMSWSAMSLPCFLSFISALCHLKNTCSEYMPDFKRQGGGVGGTQLSLYNATHPTGHTI